MKLVPIRDRNLKLDGGAMFGIVPKVLWNKKYPADDNNQCNWAIRCLLVDTGEKIILIDAGLGNKQDEKFWSMYHPNGDYSMENDLQENGYCVEDITDIIFTHLHFDHCGGAIKYNEDKTKLEPVFPNAEYWVSKKQWELALQPNKREKGSFLKENILPIEETDRLNIVEEEDKEIYPGIRLVQFHGHTLGQIIPYICYQGRVVAYIADLLASTAHIPMPWIMGYDSKPLVTLDDKKRFYDEAVPNDFVLFFEHDLYNECCTLQMTEKGVRCKDTFTLKELFG